PGIAGIDTRALTRHLREAGAMMGALATDGASVEELRALVDAAPPMAGAELVSEVTTDAPYAFEQPSWGRARPSPRVHVVVFDFGVKRNILRRLVDAGARVTVVPARTKLEALEELAPDGVLLSNGPGDPAAVSEVISEVRRILEARPALPVFGICLGHQILCLALGGRTYKLKFGHHGGNHPVRSERGGRVAITAQNHGFAVDLSSLGPAELDQVNLFDGTVAGFRLRDRPVWGVQYHPEDAPGPHDANPLIAEFVQTVARVAGAA
ncbi:MAG: glutamine-hydrolyzing carbamoyl-phosphate synthase small subunit, partial [Myxococcales bacterium]|nr:glutamine-hydrolyzing carbamoyl-phosphate synthase small subunit [Myxococcales bacterium]